MGVNRKISEFRVKAMRREQRARNLAPKEFRYRVWTMAAILLLMIVTWGGWLVDFEALTRIGAFGLLVGIALFVAIGVLMRRKVVKAGYEW